MKSITAIGIGSKSSETWEVKKYPIKETTITTSTIVGIMIFLLSILFFPLLIAS